MAKQERKISGETIPSRAGALKLLGQTSLPRLKGCPKKKALKILQRSFDGFASFTVS